MVKSSLALVILCTVLLDGASVSKKSKNPFPMNHFYNGSNVKIFNINVQNNNSSNEKKSVLQQRKILDDLKHVQNSIRKMEKMISVLNGARRGTHTRTSTQAKDRTVYAIKAEAATKRIGRKFAFVFHPTTFKLKPSHKIQGTYGKRKYIFLNSSQSSNAPSFLEVRKLLDPYLINVRQIHRMGQYYGYTNTGKVVVQVLSPNGTINNDANKWEYCEEGNHSNHHNYNKNEMATRWFLYFYRHDVKRFMMCGGDRRTVLWVY